MLGGPDDGKLGEHPWREIRRSFRCMCPEIFPASDGRPDHLVGAPT
jgi:hypothetical protein